MTDLGLVMLIITMIWFFGFVGTFTWHVLEYVAAKDSRDPEDVKKQAVRVLISPLWPFLALLWLIELFKDAR